MSYCCVPQILGLIRGEPEPGKKHRANGKKILAEMGDERKSRSKTLDKSRSQDNEYSECLTDANGDTVTSGEAVWEQMEADAEAYRITGINKKGQTFSRKLREDAKIGFAGIFKPPAQMTEGWSDDDFYRFFNDSFDTLATIEPRLFREENFTMAVIHYDEDSPHCHFAGYCKDSEGHYNGNLVDALLLVRINEQYPELMRQKGWDIADADQTDYHRMSSDAGYKARRTAKAKRQGLSVNEYDLMKEADRLRAESQAMEAEKKRLKALEDDLTSREAAIKHVKAERSFELPEPLKRASEGFDYSGASLHR